MLRQLRLTLSNFIYTKPVVSTTAGFIFYQRLCNFNLDYPYRTCYYRRVRGGGGTADAHGSGPCELTLVRVQIPFSARGIRLLSGAFFLVHLGITKKEGKLSSFFLPILISFSRAVQALMRHTK